MRQLVGFCAVLLLSGLALGQDDSLPLGAFAQPFAPRLATPSASPQELVTPSLALDSPSLATGASNATTSSPSVHFYQPLWYSPGVQFDPTIYESSAPQAQVSSGASTPPEPHRFELGAATFQSSYGVARLMGNGPRGKTRRNYTNADVARVNDANGAIKLGQAGAGEVKILRQSRRLFRLLAPQRGLIATGQSQDHKLHAAR
jgi:hypothetical protein